MWNVKLIFRLSLAVFLALLMLGTRFGRTHAQIASQSDSSKWPIHIVDGYPEFRLHGQPFFVHSAAFFYNRIPRDEWGASLVKLKSMGINTIDLYLAWNWHEPEEGKLDFDGATNPRRDVKRLLEMLDEMGFASIVRPGPVILNEWRNGGYPDWLLARPEFGMNETARLDGHYPPLSGLSPTNSEDASRQWLENETHLKYTRKWFSNVMRELLGTRQATNGGNIIAIQLDDDQAINRANYNGPVFWKYMNTLAGYLREAGATVPLYINPTDMRVSAAGAPYNIGAMGQWYFNFGSDPALQWEDTATLQFYTETLKTQPHFPPMMIEYQAGWYGTGEDTYAKIADPTNTLLSSRVMIGHGLRGLNYFPAQDTLYPAGYEVPWANHYYTWESALNLGREERDRASAIYRNGRLIAGLGRELASVHKTADLGLIYPISSYDQEALTRDDIMRISRAQMQIQQYCQLNQVSVEYIDLEFQTLEHLQRHKALLLPVFDPATSAQGREEISAANEPSRRRGAMRLSELAQQKLIAYVKAGGKLMVTPKLPDEAVITQITKDLIVVPDFWREIPLEPGKMNREEVIARVSSNSSAFDMLLRGEAKVSKSVSYQIVEDNGKTTAWEPNFTVTRLIPAINHQDSNKYSFFNLINFDKQRPLKVTLTFPMLGATDDSKESISTVENILIRPREAMLLPCDLPIGESGEEKIDFATAELISREMAGGKIFLRFYAPDPAIVGLKLPHPPQGKVTINGLPTDSSYNQNSKTLRIKLHHPANKKQDGTSDRRENELDVEIEYEAGLPQLNIKPARFIIGENNHVTVEFSTQDPQLMTGKLSLSVERGLKSEVLSLDVTLNPRESRSINFSVPIGRNAVDGDEVRLHATFFNEAKGRRYTCPTVRGEIRKRFDWRIYPNVTWPLRADTKQTITPPLIYPTDDNATSSSFNLRFLNNTSQEITLSRKTTLVNALPLKLKPDEEILSTYSYKFAPGTKSVLNPFRVTITDGTLTETADVNFVALRKGEAVAFSYDIDRDGFDDYVMENEHLRLIISPNAGARAFALINKHTGANIFTSVGGLRDKFVELDPQDPARNPRRKRGMYGTFNRPYAAEIVEGMGKRVTLKLSYDAADIYPGGARIERVVVLKAEDQFFTADYLISPQTRTVDGTQAFWVANSITAGDPALNLQRFVAADGAFKFEPAKTRALDVQSGWVAVPVDERYTFGLIWRGNEVSKADVEMKDFSAILNVKFKPFATAEAYSYRLAYYLGTLRPEQFSGARAKIIGE